MRKPDYASGPETPDFSPGSGFIRARIKLNTRHHHNGSDRGERRYIHIPLQGTKVPRMGI